MYIYATLGNSASRKLVMGIYNSSGDLLGTTYEMTGSGRGTGTFGIDLQSQVAVSNGQDYWLMVNINDVNIKVGQDFFPFESSDTLDNTYTYDTTLPDPLPSDLGNVTNEDIDIYADDTWINPPTELTADAAIQVAQSGSVTADALIDVAAITSAALLSVL
jgi:hypothetical protein